ncbi:MAG: UDP-glucose/GDP-mannose dehydrogenase family protein [Candidatus Komeilibacteria bacterium]|nr:UDP-glucose/GDP-mannose dehydrogenase family protein [Candidatus Komeilibacteria bacterium]
MFDRITIAGLGIVGSAVQAYLNGTGLAAQAYDPPKGLKDASVLKKADIVFITVPTPYTENGFDLRYVNEVVHRIGDNAIVVIKSTVLPGTTDAYQRQHPNLKMMFSPEFLTEKTATHDFSHPTRQIVGYTEVSRDVAPKVLDLLPPAPYRATMRAAEAEMIKYMNNVFYALKVTYANQLYDLCEAMGIDYNLVVEGATSSEPMMGQNHWDVMFGGYRGYDGKCLPKDVRALIQFGTEHHIDISLLEKIEELNNRRMAGKDMKSPGSAL